jgi:hypothetical protein
MSTAKDIAAQITSRIQGITIANGFLTDIGLCVYRGRRRLDETNLPCAVISEGADQVVEHLRASARVIQKYSIEGHTECDADHPNDKAHDIISDLKRALFTGDITFGGPVKKVEYNGRNIVPREDGFKAVAASIDIDISYVDQLTAP